LIGCEDIMYIQVLWKISRLFQEFNCGDIQVCNLTSMGPGIANVFSSIINKMQSYTIYLFIYLFMWNILHVPGCFSAIHQELKTVSTALGTLSDLYCYLPLSWMIWNSGVPTHPTLPNFSGGSSVHHQELKTVYTAPGTLSNLYCYLPPSWKSWNSGVPTLPWRWQLAVKVRQSTWCCIYSFELLMMGGGAAWNI
jgi:hypothetical protein